MSLPGWVHSLSNVGQDFQGALSFGGWIVAAGGWAVSSIRRYWIFRDKASLADERDLALKKAALDRQDAELCRREADLANHRAIVAETTVEALNTAIENLRTALTAELAGVRSEVQGLQHKTFLQTQFIRDLWACIKNGAPIPEIPEALRDDLK